MSGRRVLVVGGSGFVGLNVTEALVRRGDTAVVFSPVLLPPAAERAFADAPGRVETVRGDVRDGDALAAACRGVDGVIHVAAVTAGAAGDLDRAVDVLDVNTLGTARVLAAARGAGAYPVVVTSSGAVYGDNATAADELSDSVPPAIPDTVYAISKFAAERLAIRARRALGEDVRTLRLGSVFGPWERDTGVRDTLSPIYQATALARAGEPVVLPRPGRRDWIYARDIATGILAALDHPEGFDGPINVGPGAEWTVADWCERLAARIAGFSHAFASEGRPATVDYHGAVDRAPFSNRRLTRELGVHPAFDIDAAFADYMDWLDRARAQR